MPPWPWLCGRWWRQWVRHRGRPLKGEREGHGEGRVVGPEPEELGEQGCWPWCPSRCPTVPLAIFLGPEVPSLGPLGPWSPYLQKGLPVGGCAETSAPSSISLSALGVLQEPPATGFPGSPIQPGGHSRDPLSRRGRCAYRWHWTQPRMKGAMGQTGKLRQGAPRSRE